MSQKPKPLDRKRLDPSPEQMRQHGYDVVDRIVDHLETLTDQRVAKRGSCQQYMELVDEPLPSGPSGIEECIEFYFDRVVPLMTRVNHPRFHAYIPCPSSFAGSLGMMLAAGTNPFTGSWLGGATLAALELTVLRWIVELLELDSACEGIFTSGGSIANMAGLAAARAKFGRAMLDKGVVYVSSEGHASVDKAAKVLGFDPRNIRVVESDSQFRIDLGELIRAIDDDRSKNLTPFFVAANAGTTNTGAIDDLSTVSEICRQNGMWFHVDAAYGGFAAMVPEVRAEMTGIELADSITLDPHKWLYCPMGVGCALVQNGQYLKAAFSTHGNYLKDLPDDEVNFLDRGPELSRQARVLPVWMLLKSAGKEQLVKQIRCDIQLAILASELLEQDQRFEVDKPRLSIVTFRHRKHDGESEAERAARDDALMEATLEDGTMMLSSTLLKGTNTLRLVVMNHRTSEHDIRLSIEKICEFAC